MAGLMGLAKPSSDKKLTETVDNPLNKSDTTIVKPKPKMQISMAGLMGLANKVVPKPEQNGNEELKVEETK